MTDLINTGTGGTNGTFVTLANSAGGGTPFSNYVVGGATNPPDGNASCVYSNALAGSGLPITIRLTLGGSPAYLRWDVSEAGTRFVSERDFYVPTTISSRATLLDVRSSAGVMASIVISSDKRPMLTNPTTTDVAASKPATALESGTLYRLKLAITKETATAAGNGKVEFAIYASDGITLLHSYTKSDSTTTAANVSQYRFGDSSANSSFTHDFLGVTAAGPRASGWITPIATPLDTPELTIVENNKPTTSGGSDGSLKVSWPAIAGAHHYEAGIATGDVETGFTVVSTSATSPYTFTGLTAGQKTVAIKAKASA